MGDELDKYIEQERIKAIAKEFGNPLDVLAGNIAEKGAGLMSALGYAADSPTLTKLGENVRGYGDALYPKGREYTGYEKGAEYLGQIAPGAAVTLATKSAALGSGLDAMSEVGTIINELQRQGYSDEEIKKKLPEIIGSEGISALGNAAIGKIGLDVINSKKAGGLARKIFGAEIYGAGQLADQPFQNLIYKEATKVR